MKFCEVCGINVNAKGYAGHCNSLPHKNKCLELYCDNVHLIKSAFKGRIRIYRVMPTVSTDKLSEFKQNVKAICLTLSEDVLKEHSRIKINFELFGLFYLQSKEIHEVKSFNCKALPVFSTEDLSSVWNTSFSIIEGKMEQFSENDSGWVLVEILYLEIAFSRLKVL